MQLPISMFLVAVLAASADGAGTVVSEVVCKAVLDCGSGPDSDFLWCFAAGSTGKMCGTSGSTCETMCAGNAQSMADGEYACLNGDVFADYKAACESKTYGALGGAGSTDSSATATCTIALLTAVFALLF